MDKKIKHIIASIRFRLCLTQLFERCPYFLLAGALPAFVCALIGYLFPLYYANITAYSLLFIGFMTGLLVTLRKLPSVRGAAHAADRFIGHDRTLTALELCGQNSAVAHLQKEDALKRLETLDFKENFPFHLHTLSLCSALLLLSLSIMFSLLPSEARQLAAEQHALKEKIKEETTALEEIQESLMEERETLAEQEEKTGAAALPDNIYEDLQSTLTNVKDSFQEAASEKDLAYGKEYISAKMQTYRNHLSSTEQAQKTLEQIAEKYGLTDPKMLAEASKKEDNSSDNSSSDDNPNGDNASSEETSGNSANGGSDSSNSDSGDGSSNSNGDGNNANGDNNVSESDGNASKNASSSSGGSENSNTNDSNSANLGTSENFSNNHTTGNTNNNNSNNNTTNGSTKKSDNNSSNSNNNNNSNNGNNNGSGNTSDKNGNGSSSGKNNGNGNGDGKNYGSKNGVERKTSLDNDAEKITIMDNTDSDEESLTGNASENGNSTKTSSNKERKAGVKQELGNVIANYKKNANAAISNNSVPSEMSELVRSYFNQFN